MRPLTGWVVWAASAVALLSAGAVAAASFDCAAAGSRVEHMICNDVRLSMLDGQLEAAYAGAARADQQMKGFHTRLRVG